MIFQGLKIDMVVLDEICDRQFLRTEVPAHGDLRTVQAHDIITTGARFGQCFCEDLGLREGMTVYHLMRLGSGCCDSRVSPGRGWVCPRLVAIRRKYGH